MAEGKDQAEATTRSRDGTWGPSPFAFRPDLCNIVFVCEA